MSLAAKSGQNSDQGPDPNPAAPEKLRFADGVNIFNQAVRVFGDLADGLEAFLEMGFTSLRRVLAQARRLSDPAGRRHVASWLFARRPLVELEALVGGGALSWGDVLVLADELDDPAARRAVSEQFFSSHPWPSVAALVARGVVSWQQILRSAEATRDASIALEASLTWWASKGKQKGDEVWVRLEAMVKGKLITPQQVLLRALRTSDPHVVRRGAQLYTDAGLDLSAPLGAEAGPAAFAAMGDGVVDGVALLRILFEMGADPFVMFRGELLAEHAAMLDRPDYLDYVRVVSNEMQKRI